MSAPIHPGWPSIYLCKFSFPDLVNTRLFYLDRTRLKNKQEWLVHFNFLQCIPVLYFNIDCVDYICDVPTKSEHTHMPKTSGSLGQALGITGFTSISITNKIIEFRLLLLVMALSAEIYIESVNCGFFVILNLVNIPFLLSSWIT
jgi:hypothetical protein